MFDFLENALLQELRKILDEQDVFKEFENSQWLEKTPVKAFELVANRYGKRFIDGSEGLQESIK